MNSPPRLRLGLHTAAIVVLALLAAVASQFVQATYGGGGPTPPEVRPATLPAPERARLRIVEGMPVARLAGSAREMGRQHGVIFKEQMHFLHREYLEAMAVKTLGRAAVESWAKACEPHIPEAFLEEMRGMAEGSGLSYADVLIANTVTDRLQNLLCSTAVASGEATADGEILFGRNLDFPGRNILHRMTVVVVYERDGTTPVATVTWPGLMGALSGMNAKGVCGATMMIHSKKEIVPGVPYTLMYREALEKAGATADIAAHFEKTRRTCPNNFMVVDATGAAEVIEYDTDAVARRTAPEATPGALCCTNHFRTESLKDVGWPVGLDRYDSLAAFMQRERGKIDLPRMIGALRDVAKPWFMNVQSMVFLPARSALHISIGGALPAAAQPFAHLDRGVLFGELGKLATPDTDR